MGSTQSTWGQSPIDAIIMRLTIVFVLTVMGVMVLLAEAKPTDPLPTNPFNGDESLAEPPIEEEPSGEPPNEDKSPDTSSSQRFRRQVGLRLDGTPELNATINATAEDIIEEVANRLQQQASPNDFRLDGTPDLNATINATAEYIIEKVSDRFQQQASAQHSSNRFQMPQMPGMPSKSSYRLQMPVDDDDDDNDNENDDDDNDDDDHDDYDDDDDHDDHDDDHDEKSSKSSKSDDDYDHDDDHDDHDDDEKSPKSLKSSISSKSSNRLVQMPDLDSMFNNRDSNVQSSTVTCGNGECTECTDDGSCKNFTMPDGWTQHRTS